MADQQKVVYGLSNGAIFNDLEQLLTQFSKSLSHYTLTLNISKVKVNSWTYYSATYMSQTRDQQRMWPSIASANGQLDPRCS